MMYYKKKEREDLLIGLMRRYSTQTVDGLVATITPTVIGIMSENTGLAVSSIKHYLSDMCKDGVIRRLRLHEYLLPRD